MRALRLNDFEQYYFLSRLAFAPEGGHSAFVAAQANSKNGYDRHIYLCRDNAILRLTAGGKEGAFLWEDGHTILFTGQREQPPKNAKNAVDFTCFYRISIHGGEATFAFALPMAVSGFQRLGAGLYAIAGSFPRLQTDFAPIDPQSPPALAEKPEDGWDIIEEVPFWANGSGLTGATRTSLFLFDEAAGTCTPITAPHEELEDFRAAVDGHAIAYTVYHPAAGARPLAVELRLHFMDDTAPVLPPVSGFNIANFDFWGHKLIFAGADQKTYGMSENPCFYMLDEQDGTYGLLAPNDCMPGGSLGSDSRLGGGGTYQIWGDTLYFSAVQGVTADIFALDLPTATVRPVTRAEGSWDSFAVGKNGIQAIAMVDDHLQELYRLGVGGYTKISAFHDDFHREVAYSKPLAHVIPAAEGFAIDGWVIPPVAYSPGQKYPTILHIHGGPKTAQGDVYFHELQLWAAAGYFVLYCNPRGSDGRGNAFADIRGQYGTCDYQNIMDFLDAMLARYPDMDEERLGVTGGSYGGYMTNWIIGHSGRFQAAVSQRSIANWISMENTSDIGYFFAPDQIGADTWHNPEKAWFHSPLAYADQCTTPTLFLHSDSDYRCWVAEGYQMFTALKRHGVDTRLCVFRGENHELSRSGKPANRKKRMEEILAWMDKYLKD